MSNPVIVIHANGDSSLELLPESDTLGFLQTACDGWVDAIRGVKSIDVWVNDEALYRKRTEPNLAASFLATLVSGYPVPVYGSAVIAAVGPEGETVGLDDDRFAFIASALFAFAREIECLGCGARKGESCDPFCIGLAAKREDYESKDFPCPTPGCVYSSAHNLSVFPCRIEGN